MLSVLSFLLLIASIITLVVFLILWAVKALTKTPYSIKRYFIYVSSAFALIVISVIVGVATNEPSEKLAVSQVSSKPNVATVNAEKEDTTKSDAMNKKEDEAKEKPNKEDVEVKKKAKKDEERKQSDLAKIKTKNANWLKTTLPLFTDKNLKLQDVSYDYIIENHDVFPATNPDTIIKAKGMTDTAVTVKHLNKNVAPYLEKMMTFSGSVITIEEETINGEKAAAVHVLDDNFNSYIVLYLYDTDDIFEDDNIQVWGVPVGSYSFENVMGGHTNSQMFFGSVLEKK